MRAPILRPARPPQADPDPMPNDDHPLPTCRFDALADAVRNFRDERDWKQFHRPKDLALSIAIESGELLEHFQWRTDDEIAARLSDAGARDAVGKEMADILILLISASDVLGIDLIATARAKLAENAAKYPIAKSRGRADKYDRL